MAAWIIVAKYWPIWIGLLLLASINRAFTVHEARAVRVSVARWYLSTGALTAAKLLVATSLVLNLIDYAGRK